MLMNEEKLHILELDARTPVAKASLSSVILD